MDKLIIPIDVFLDSDYKDTEIMAALKYLMLWARFEREPTRKQALRYIHHSNITKAITIASSMSDYMSEYIHKVENKRGYAKNKMAQQRQKIENVTGNKEECYKNVTGANKIKENKIKLNNNNSYNPLLKNDDFEDIKNAWNVFAENNGLAKVMIITDKRKSAIRCRVKEPDFKLDEIFEKIEKSNFLLGKSGDWRCDFDFVFCSANNYIKILEGKYDNTSNSGKRNDDDYIGGIKKSEIEQLLEQSKGNIIGFE